MTNLLKLLDKMCSKYEMNLASIVDNTEWTRFLPYLVSYYRGLWLPSLVALYLNDTFFYDPNIFTQGYISHYVEQNVPEHHILWLWNLDWAFQLRQAKNWKTTHFSRKK